MAFLVGQGDRSRRDWRPKKRRKKAQDPALARRFRRKCLGEAADAWVY
jgi:hypothetical protein